MAPPIQEQIMTYRIVTRKRSIAAHGFSSYQSAFTEACRLYGDDMQAWLVLNLRIEESQ